MSEITGLKKQGGRPSGLLGKIIGRMMNTMHKGAYWWGLSHIQIGRDMSVLDIGCGGGRFVKILAQNAKLVYGIDHSEEMIGLARRVNKREDNVELKCASVLEIPNTSKTFDIVSAFETVQHWPDIPAAFLEVRRVLKASGVFMIVNRYPDANSKWLDFLKLKNAAEYKAALNAAGFCDIVVDTSKNNWICVIGHSR